MLGHRCASTLRCYCLLFTTPARAPRCHHQSPMIYNTWPRRPSCPCLIPTRAPEHFTARQQSTIEKNERFQAAFISLLSLAICHRHLVVNTERRAKAVGGATSAYFLPFIIREISTVSPRCCCHKTKLGLFRHKRLRGTSCSCHHTLLLSMPMLFV